MHKITAGRLTPGTRLALVLLLFAAACAGPRKATDPAGPPSAREEPGTARTIQGFRIQILTSQDKAEADQEVEEAVQWWQDLPPSQRPPGLGTEALDVAIKWQQPYYRVRLGNFTTQADANQVIQQVRQRFPDAFIVPDLVTVYR